MKVELKKAGTTGVEVRGYTDNKNTPYDVVLLANYGDGWTVGMSSCMPSNFSEAYDQHRVVTAAFELVRDYEADTADIGDVRYLGEDDTMKGLGER